MWTAVQPEKSKSHGKQKQGGKEAKQTRRVTRHRRELTSQREQQSAVQAEVSCRNWLPGKGALYRETLQATGRTTRILIAQESLRRCPPCQFRESACIKLSERAMIFQRTEL